MVADRLHVLSGEENLLEQVKYEPGAADRLIETLRQRYNFIIIDAPFTGMDLHRDLLMLGHQRILVWSRHWSAFAMRSGCWRCRMDRCRCTAACLFSTG